MRAGASVWFNLLDTPKLNRQVGALQGDRRPVALKQTLQTARQ